VLASLAYSFRLVRGNWWRVASIYAVGVTVIWTFCMLVATLAAMVMAGDGTDVGADDAALTRAITSAAVLAVLAVGLTFCSALTLALFGDLEVRRVTGRSA
jgi:hypothetical protein